MSLRELSDLTKANNSSAFKVESQETYLKQLRTRNAKLKLKSQELETWLRQLITNIEDKNKLKSSLLEIRRDIQARSQSNVTSGKLGLECVQIIFISHLNTFRIKVSILTWEYQDEQVEYSF